MPEEVLECDNFSPSNDRKVLLPIASVLIVIGTLVILYCLMVATASGDWVSVFTGSVDWYITIGFYVAVLLILFMIIKYMKAKPCK